jgi:hypothetical protein
MNPIYYELDRRYIEFVVNVACAKTDDRRCRISEGAMGPLIRQDDHLISSSRTDLQRHDLSAGGREAIQVRVDLAPGVAFPTHTHPGGSSTCSAAPGRGKRPSY